MTSQAEVLKRNRYVPEGGPDIAHSSRNHVEDWEEYHLPLLRMHHASLHGWGVASGLEVSVTADGAGVEVEPGVAVDSRGELIALSAGGQADISVVEPGETDGQIGAPFRLSTAELAGQVLYLTIQYLQRLRETEGGGGQLEQTPWLRLQAVAGDGAFVDDGVSIILAVVAVDAAGATTVHDSLAAAPRARRLLDTSATALHLRRPAMAAGNVGQAVGQIVAAEMTAEPGAGLRVRLAEAADSVLFEQGSGGNFAAFSLRADLIQLHGTLDVRGGATFAGDLQASGALRATGAATFGGPLSAGTVVADTLTISTAATFGGSLSAGAVIADTLTISTAATLGATLVQGDLQVSGGNVGIGTDTPVDKLTIREGDIQIEGGRYRRLKIVSDSYWAGIELVAREQDEGGNPHIDFTHGDLDAPNYGIRLYAPSNNQFIIEGSSVGVTGTLLVSGAIQAGNSDLYFTKVDHNHTGSGNTAGYAAIENAANYDALMILGRAGTTRGRYVRLWDYLQVNGSMDVTGNLTIAGSLGTHGYSPTPRTSGWGGGIHTWDIEAEGTMWSRGGYQSGNRDLAENYASAAMLEPGEVVCLYRDEDRVMLSDKPNDSLVLGVVSTAPGVLLNESHDPESSGIYPIALCGRVPCKVVTENGCIRRGDLLASSSTPGHAMKAQPVVVDGQPVYRPGTIIGKALGSLESGAGVIDIFVSLS